MIQVLKGKKWRNWSRTSASRPAKTFYPSSVADVVAIVNEAARESKKIRVVGAGHSFTRIVETDDWLLSLDRLTGIDEWQEDKGTVSVFAGTRLYEIGRLLGERGYALENLGDTNVQSIAGAISTGTHGTGIQFGSISTQATEIVLVTAKGEVLTISEKENKDYFHASLVSLGMLGIIVKVTLKIIETPIYEFKSYKLPYRELVEQLDELIETNRHFEVFMFPYSDLLQVKTMNMTEQPPQRLTFYEWKNLILENYLFSIISTICRFIPITSKFFSKMSAKAVGTSTIRAESYKLFATPRLVRFREIEYSIPLEHFAEALRDVRETIEKNRYAVHFPIECRTVKADDIWLSSSYKRDSAYIAFHMYKGMPYEQYFRDMEQIMRKYRGRPHWGKMHYLQIDDLHERYPKLRDFLHLRAQLDPKGMFLNDYLKDLFAIDEQQLTPLQEAGEGPHR